MEYVSRVAQIIDVDAPSIERDKVLAILPTKDEWMNKLILYMTHGVMLDVHIWKKKVMIIASSHRMVTGCLYKLSFDGSLLRCFT